ncbi:acetoin utilization protein AcuC [Candidatus Hodarchaeum mangrovi]
MITTGIIWSDQYLTYNLGEGHPMNPKRLLIPFQLLKSLKIFGRPEIKHIEPQKASDDDILLFHTPKYLEIMKELSRIGKGYDFRYGLGTGDCPVFHGMHESSSLIVGGALEGIKRIMNGDINQAFSLLGGLHHAFAEKAAGFCYYNDVVIAIRFLQKKYNIKKVLYVDTDVHAGDGVLDAFYAENSVLGISIHESPQFIFPGTGLSDEIGEKNGLGYSLNLPLYPGTWDDNYIEMFESLIPCIWEEYDPEFVVWQCGADGHFRDVLGHLNLTTNLYSYLGMRISELTRISNADGKLLLLGGGGYNPDSVARVWLAILMGITGISFPDESPSDWIDFCRTKYNIVANKQINDPKIDPYKIENYKLIHTANEQYLNVLKEELRETQVWKKCKALF